jgi:hypothetical protein
VFASELGKGSLSSLARVHATTHEPGTQNIFNFPQRILYSL